MVILPFSVTNPEGRPFETASYLAKRIEMLLGQLQSPDTLERCEAMNELRSVPEKTLMRAWRKHRTLSPPLGWETDVLERMFVKPPPEPIRGKKAIVTVASEGFEPLLDTLITSLMRYGNMKDTKLVVFSIGRVYDWMLEKFGFFDWVTPILCQACSPMNPGLKSVLYSASRWVDAEIIFAIETDMLVLSDLTPLWNTVSELHPTAMAGVRPHGVGGQRLPLTAVWERDGLPESDWEFLTGHPGKPFGRFVFNGGTMIGQKLAWDSLNTTLREMGPGAIMWVDGGMVHTYRDELLMNVALNMTGDHAEVADVWNVQVFQDDRDSCITTSVSEKGMLYEFEGKPAKILHFYGTQKRWIPIVMQEIEDRGLSPLHAV